MRVVGAMSLLLNIVDTDKIKLLGRWRSNAMMRYLHIMYQLMVQGFTDNIASSGNYAEIPSNRDN